jgi:hypothetical protein
MMQFAERHVLTVNEPSVVKKVLDAFSVGVQAQVWVSPETRRGLVEFSKQGFKRLILNLQVTKDPFTGSSAACMNLNACQVGGVLVLTGQVNQPWMLQLEELCRRPFFPRRPLTSFGALVAEVETAVQRFARPIWRAKGKSPEPDSRENIR